MTLADESWGALTKGLDALRLQMGRSSADRVGAAAIRDQVRSLVQHYFRTARPHLGPLGFTEDDLQALDAAMQGLLTLANARSRRASYLTTLGQARRAVGKLEVQRELLIGGQVQTPPSTKSSIEVAILQTLTQLLPSAALSYEQALLDLADPGHLSFRGTANELRSALWDVLDRLAPDADVLASGVELQKGQSKPTQKQKARYILRSRDMPENARKAPEAGVGLVEELTASLARASYERSSISAHVATVRAEVQQLKMYVDSVLAELLAVHSLAS